MGKFDAVQVKSLFDTIEREAGRLDILVNNAANQGLGHGGPLEMKPEMFYDVFKTNVVGGFQVTQSPVLITTTSPVLISPRHFPGRGLKATGR